MNPVKVSTNLRSVKRVEGGFALSTSKGSDLRQLCDHCTQVAECKLLRKRDRLQEKGAMTLIVRSCGEYVPPLTFGSEKGLNASFVNTLRLGDSWSKRLGWGDHVDLLDLSLNRIKRVVVTKICVGLKEEIIGTHAQFNHMFVEEKLTQGEAAAEMIRLLPTLYGGLIYRNNVFATAIYFEEVL